MADTIWAKQAAWKAANRQEARPVIWSLCSPTFVFILSADFVDSHQEQKCSKGTSSSPDRHSQWSNLSDEHQEGVEDDEDEDECDESVTCRSKAQLVLGFNTQRNPTDGLNSLRSLIYSSTIYIT